MKITLTQERLSKALNYVSRSVSTKPNIPVLSNVLLEVEEDDLKLSATNLDMGIHMWIGGQADSSGKVTVSGKFISDFISAGGSGKVVLQMTGEKLDVKLPTASADFQTISAEEFPVLPKVTGEALFTVDAKELISSLQMAIFASSTELATSQIQFTGILFSLAEGANGSVKLAGLDGYRLSETRLSVERDAGKAHDIIVPARALQEMLKILSSEGSQKVSVYLSESKSQIIFTFDQIEFSIRLLEGPYPKYDQIVPKQTSFMFDVVKSELEQALKIVNTFARNLQGYRVDWDLDIETSTLTMRSQVPNLGVNEAKVQLKNVTGATDLKNAFNLMYLIDLTNHIPGEIIHFETNSPLEPAVFTSKEAKGFMHLIMPLQRD